MEPRLRGATHPEWSDRAQESWRKPLEAPEQVREELLQFWLDRGDTAEEAEIKVDDYLLRRPSWTREEAEAHAVAKWKEEARKWARRVRDKARPVWPRLEQLAEWMEGRRGGKRSLEFITPEEEVVDLSGFRVVFRGFAESPYQDELPRLKEGLARFRRAAQARAPIILKRIVPIHIEWTFEPTSRGDAGAYYTRGMIYVTPWEIGKDMGRFVHVLAHEMGHHLYQTVLSGQATKEWDSFIRGTYTDLDLRDVLRRMEALGAKGLYFDKALREDPILYLQLEGLQQGRRELRNLMDADDVREYLEAGGDPNVRVMAMPISGYAHKNPQEAFCEALGKLVAYGPKAVPDVVLGMLRRVLPTVRISSDKQAYVSTMPATEDCDAIVSAAWVSPQGKMVFLRGQTHEGFAEKWALRNEPDLHAQIVEHGQTARPHASIWHRVMLDRGWLQLQGMSSIVVPPRPSRKQLQNVADFFANCIADGTSDPDRITLHIFGLSPSLRGKPIEPGEDRYPFDVQERVSLADFIEREASGPVIEDMYQAMMERTRRASLIEAWGPTLREARGKAKKDVGHGGLDEWFSGHGGAKGKGEGATWGDWVSISPITKTLPSGKKVEKGDIVGECGISDDPDWKEITKGGEDPLKCMPRSKAYDMPKKERAEKAKAKQKAEKADSSRGKKPTMTPTFDKPKKKASGIDRVFRSPKPFTGFRPVSGQGHDFKPKGLWYSCGSAWDDWCRYEMPSGITGAPLRLPHRGQPLSDDRHPQRRGLQGLRVEVRGPPARDDDDRLEGGRAGLRRHRDLSLPAQVPHVLDVVLPLGCGERLHLGIGCVQVRRIPRVLWTHRTRRKPEARQRRTQGSDRLDEVPVRPGTERPHWRSRLCRRRGRPELRHRPSHQGHRRSDRYRGSQREVQEEARLGVVRPAAPAGHPCRRPTSRPTSTASPS